jgi:hypothetical protein
LPDALARVTANENKGQNTDGDGDGIDVDGDSGQSEKVPGLFCSNGLESGTR